MRYTILFTVFILFINSAPLTYSSSVENNELKGSSSVKLAKKMMAFDSYVDSFYDCVNNSTLKREVLMNGLKGYFSLKFNQKLTNKKYLTLIDYSLASNKKRFFVIDVENKKIVFNSIIAHGKNSGGLFATKFSNISESKMSSLGFFVTGNTYDGKYKYSLKLNGLEYCNNNVFERGVVVHSADYATQKFLKQNGNTLGRSYGCPAIPHKDYKKVVDTIKNGSCFFIYGKDNTYNRKSTYLKPSSFIDCFYSEYE